ncbi:hypothetical protein HDU91_001835, partial [Kappamyces sp. JEL0680]
MTHRAASSKAFVTATCAFGIFTDTVSKQRLTQYAYSVVIPFMPAMVQQFGGQDKDIGIIQGFFSIGLIGSSLLFGLASDATGNRKVGMILGLGCLSIATGLMAWLQTYWSLVLGRFIQGVASGSIWVLGLALVADSLDSTDDVGQTMSSVFMCYTLGGFVGPLAGGYLYELGTFVPFLSIIVFAVIDGILRLMVVERPGHSVHQVVEMSTETLIDAPTLRSTADATTRGTRAIWRSAMKNKFLWMILATIASCGLIVGGSEVALVLQFERHYGLTTGQSGLAFLAVIVPQLLAAPVGGMIYDRTGYRATVLPGIVACSVAIAVWAIPLP